MTQKTHLPPDLIGLTNSIYEVYDFLNSLEENYYSISKFKKIERSIILILLNEKKITVPELARRKSLTRQRIQQIMNILLKMKFIEKKGNSSNLLSPNYYLTKSGKSIGLKFIINEKKFFNKFRNDFTSKEIQSGINLLFKFKEKLSNK